MLRVGFPGGSEGKEAACSAGDQGSISGCGVGGASQDSGGFGAMEEGLISREGRNLRLPLREGNTEGPGTASSEPLLPS